MHVSMRAAMRPADAGRGIDSRTRRIEQGARVVAAPPVLSTSCSRCREAIWKKSRREHSCFRGGARVGCAPLRDRRPRRRRAAQGGLKRDRGPRVAPVPETRGRVRAGRGRPGRRRRNPGVPGRGDCTAPGAPYARLPTPAPEAEDAALLERANFEKINDEEDPVAVGSNRGLLTGPSLDLARLARAMMTNGASSGASSGAEGPPGASRRTPRNDPDDGSVSAADEAAAEARRADPGARSV